MKRILIAAYNETFRQSSDPVYAHTPMRNTGELRTFNPKLKDSAGGEVKKVLNPDKTQTQGTRGAGLWSNSLWQP